MLKKRIKLIVCLALIWTGTGNALENLTGTEPVTEIDPMVVLAEKENQDPKCLKIDTEQIRTPLSSGNILDLLEGEPGIQVRRQSQSGTGSNALRLRGFDETRFSVRQNGVPLNRDGSYGNGAVDWGSFFSESLESIEIYKGACPAKYGNTLGGVVNLVTKTPGSTPETQVHLTGGSRDTFDAGASHAWKRGPLGWRLSAGHFETDGYLRNNFMDRDRGSAQLSLDLPAGWEIGAGVEVSSTENGNPVYNRPDSAYYDPAHPLADEKELRGPGISARLINGARAWGDGSRTEDDNHDFFAYLARSSDTGGFRLQARLWNQESHEIYYASDSGKKIYERETDAEDNNWLLSALFSHSLGSHLLEAGAETRRYGWGEQRVTHIDESYFNGSINFLTFIKNGFKGQEDIMGYHALFIQDTWQVRPDLSLELGVRQEWFRADAIDPEVFGYSWATGVSRLSESHTDPRLAVIYAPTADTKISARWGIAHRYPTSPEYFWWYLNNASQYFNTSFSPERALQYELGIDQAFGKGFQCFIRGYYYDVEDYISSTTVQGVGSVYYNIGRVEIRGVETGFSVKLPLELTLWANATWQKGDKSGDPWDKDNALSNQLPDLPEFMANAGLNLDPKGPFSAKLRISWVDDREHFSDQALTVLDAYTLVNLSARYRLFKNKIITADLEAAAENILDEEYQEKEGYPMAGATVMAGLRLSF